MKQETAGLLLGFSVLTLLTTIVNCCISGRSFFPAPFHHSSLLQMSFVVVTHLRVGTQQTLALSVKSLAASLGCNVLDTLKIPPPKDYRRHGSSLTQYVCVGQLLWNIESSSFFRNIWFYILFLAVILGTGIFKLERPIVKPVGILERGLMKPGMPLGLYKTRTCLLPL